MTAKTISVSSEAPTKPGHADQAAHKEQLTRTLKEYWGFDSFRPLQYEAMQAVMDNQDSLVVFPTGGGKSLCFQAPAVCSNGLGVVVSPLISLMKAQVDSLHACGIKAAFLNRSTRQRMWATGRALA